MPVFDIAQTDGEELPSICDRLEGDDPKGLYARLVTVAGPSVSRSRTTNSTAARMAIAAMTITTYGSRRPTHPRSG